MGFAASQMGGGEGPILNVPTFKKKNLPASRYLAYQGEPLWLVFHLHGKFSFLHREALKNVIPICILKGPILSFIEG